jgi:hypothetical protein
MSSFGASKRKTTGESLALPGDDHPTLFWPGRLIPKVNDRYSWMCISRIPRTDATTTILGQAVVHLLPNTDCVLYALDILNAALSLCVTLCHLLTPIPVIKVHHSGMSR